MFTHPHVVPAPKRIANGNGHANGNLKPVYATAPIHQYPALLVKSVRVVSFSFIPVFTDPEFTPFSCFSSGQLVSSSVLYYGRKSGGGPQMANRLGAITC
jgi:hypothetical protein